LVLAGLVFLERTQLALAIIGTILSLSLLLQLVVVLEVGLAQMAILVVLAVEQEPTRLVVTPEVRALLVKVSMEVTGFFRPLLLSVPVVAVAVLGKPERMRYLTLQVMVVTVFLLLLQGRQLHELAVAGEQEPAIRGLARLLVVRAVGRAG
jgi:hypothetical protein